jgi:hypothetical protein
MTASHYNEWEIGDLQNRYKAINGIELDTIQAEKILTYEAEKNFSSSKYFFSIWEELDYEGANFKEILTDTQFESYISQRADKLNQIEQSLIENDKQYLPQLNTAKERLEYYKNIFVPSIQKNHMLFRSVFNADKEKVDFLKSEYKKYLLETKKQILVNHFRHCKTFQPVILKLALIRHEEMCLFPDYFSFKANMDYATKSVADYLKEKISRISDEFSEALKVDMDKLKEFNKNNTAKHIGEVKGWRTSLAANNKQEKLMFIILLDQGKYKS